MTIAAQGPEGAVEGGIEGVVAVALFDHFPITLEDFGGGAVGVVPLPDAHAEIAVPQGFHKIVVVLKTLLLRQTQGVGKGGVPVLRRCGRGAGGQGKTEDQCQNRSFHRSVSFLYSFRSAAGNQAHIVCLLISAGALFFVFRKLKKG